jgi:FRG domain
VIQRTVNNIAEFLDALRSDQDGNATWFRGHSRADWTLLPGIMRSSSGLSEGSSLARFKQSAAMLTERLPTNSFDWTFLMQHYGVPTRLWSCASLIPAELLEPIGRHSRPPLVRDVVSSMVKRVTAHLPLFTLAFSRVPSGCIFKSHRYSSRTDRRAVFNLIRRSADNSNGDH